MGTFNKANYKAGFKAGADLSASTNRYKAVRLTGDDEVTLCVAGGVGFIGFLQNTPADTKAAEVAGDGGGSKAIAGGTIAAGARLTTDANGDVVTATSTDTVVAKATVAAVDGDIFAVEVLDGTTIEA